MQQCDIFSSNVASAISESFFSIWRFIVWTSSRTSQSSQGKRLSRLMNGTLRGSACEVSFCSRANSSFRKETGLAGAFPGFSPRRSHLEKLHLHLPMSSVLSISQMRMRPSRDQQLLSLPLPSNDLKISWFHSVIEVSPRQYPLRKVQLDAMHHPRTHFDLQLRSVFLDFEDKQTSITSHHQICHEALTRSETKQGRLQSLAKPV